jgi:hypothetical protein
VNFRLTIILAIVLLIIGGIVFLAQKDRGNSGSTTKEDRPFVYKVEADKIARVSIETGERKVAFIRTASGWTFDDAEQTPVDQNRFGGMQYLLAGPRADRVLENEMGDPSKYGFDKALALVTITDKSGNSFLLKFGDYNADRQAQFVSLGGVEDVYLIHSSWTEVVTRLATEPPYIPTPVPEEELLATLTPEVTPTPTP